MGLACKIHRGLKNNVSLVEAPNNNASLLYEEAYNYTKNEQKALDIWAVAYTDDFKQNFGDFESGDSYIDTDINGEPRLDAVLNYLFIINAENKRLTNYEKLSISNIMLGRDIESVDSLYERLRDTFFSNGRFIINEQRLISSGLYSPMEIEGILTNPELQTQISNFIQKMRGEFMSDLSSRDISQLYVNSDHSEELQIINTSEVTALGFFRKEEPGDVYNAIVGKVGGVKDRVVFDSLIQTLPHEALVERYFEDPVFADMVYDKYSVLEVIPIVDIIGTGQETIEYSSTSSLPEIQSYFVRDTESVNRISSILDSLLNISEEAWIRMGSDIKAMLRVIQRESVSMGIDVIGLSSMYDIQNQEALTDFLVAYDTFLNNEYPDFSDIAEAYDSLFMRDVKNKQRLEMLPEHLRGLDVLSLSDNYQITESSLYRDYGLIDVGDNLYLKVDNTATKDELYSGLLSLAIDNPNLLPSEAYPGEVKTKGKVDVNKLSNTDSNDAILSSFRQHVSRLILESGQSYPMQEEAILYCLIFNVSNRGYSDIDINYELRKYNGRSDNFTDIAYAFPFRFRNFVLREKLNSTDLYNQVLKYFTFDNYQIGLSNSSEYVKRGVELLLPEGKIRADLKSYVAMTSDSSFDGLFSNEFLDDSFPSSEFYAGLYVNNPQLLPAFTGSYAMNEANDTIEVINVFDSFIKINGKVYSKVGEADSYSYYQPTGEKVHSNINYYRYTPVKALNFGRSNIYTDIGRGSYYSKDLLVVESGIDSAAGRNEILNEITC